MLTFVKWKPTERRDSQMTSCPLKDGLVDTLHLYAAERTECGIVPNLKKMNAPVKFLVLTGSAHLAFLIDRNKYLLSEVIEDDGFIVDSLLLNAKACADPRTDMFHAVVRPLSPDSTPKPVRGPQVHPDPVRDSLSNRPPVAVRSARIEVRRRPRSFAFFRFCTRSRHATKVLERKARAPICTHQG